MKNLLNKFKIKKELTNPAKKSASVEIAPKKDYEDWLTKEQEGQLVVDVYQTPKNIVIKSTVAGLRPEDLDISLANDMITIRGKREKCEEVKEEDYFYKECYWGGFSRSIILPAEVKADQARAELENGILTIILPKVKETKINIENKD
jgi:HSP20 family protein